MKNLESLLAGASAIEILIYYNFIATKTNEYYLTHIETTSSRKFFTFINFNKEIQIFDPQTFKIIDKTTLFTQLLNPKTFADVESDVERICNIATPEAPLLKPIEIFAFLNRLAALRKVSPRDFALANSTQFQNRVFSTDDGFLSIPLFKMNSGQHATSRIANFLHVKNGSFKYFNNSCNWLTTTNYRHENRFMVLTSDPNFWLNYLASTYGPDYFLVLCHPSPGIEICKLVLELMDRFGFGTVFIPLPNSKQLFCEIWCYYLNAKVDNLCFDILHKGNEFVIRVYSDIDVNHLGFISEIVRDAEKTFQQNFWGTHETGEWTDPKSLKWISIKLVELNTKLVVNISFNSIDRLTGIFFETLSKKFGISNSIEIFNY